MPAPQMKGATTAVPVDEADSRFTCTEHEPYQLCFTPTLAAIINAILGHSHLL